MISDTEVARMGEESALDFVGGMCFWGGGIMVDHEYIHGLRYVWDLYLEIWLSPSALTQGLWDELLANLPQAGLVKAFYVEAIKILTCSFWDKWVHALSPISFAKYNCKLWTLCMNHTKKALKGGERADGLETSALKTLWLCPGHVGSLCPSQGLTHAPSSGSTDS